MTEELKVGELARRTGLTVRTLHHYHDIGLLRPAGRTPAGHRLYGPDEVRRLQQIASLRQLGLSLEEVAAALDDEGMSLERALGLQIERLRQSVARQERLCGLLETLRERLLRDEAPGIDELTPVIEMTLRLERYFTPEQSVRLRERSRAVGADRMEEAQREWAELFEAFGEAMERGADPAAPEVRALARRAAGLVAEFTGGDPAVRASLDRMYREEGPDRVMAAHGMAMPPGLWEYMARARRALEAEEG